MTRVSTPPLLPPIPSRKHDGKFAGYLRRTLYVPSQTLLATKPNKEIIGGKFVLNLEEDLPNWGRLSYYKRFTLKPNIHDLLTTLLGDAEKIEINAVVPRECNDKGELITNKPHNHQMTLGRKPSGNLIVGSDDYEKPGVRANGHAFRYQTRTSIAPNGTSEFSFDSFEIKPGDSIILDCGRPSPLSRMEIARPLLHGWHALNLEKSNVVVTPQQGGKKTLYPLHGEGAWEKLPNNIQQGYQGLIDIYWAFLKHLQEPR
ncbi:MAG: hypothetical protein VKK59_05510 [Vampirovibrionales bacterium]|nr:hypothetical protein [Vampirovibrionales bacterium]